MSDTKSSLAPLVRKLLLHAKLDEQDQIAILDLPHVVRELEGSKYIVREGDKPTHSCLLVSGFVIRHKVVEGGGRQIVNIHVSGDMCDLQNSLLATADHNVQTLTRCEVAFIPREALVDLAFTRPAVGKALWLETLVEASIAREWIANVGRRDARARVAHLLCEFAYRLDAVGLGEECNFQLPMTQEQLADTTGLTPVHVNRTLKGLDNEGLTTRTKRSVKINDWKRMAQVADFRSTYLHLPDKAL
ncbi:MAG TPA: Crp/Fnr family transcriptional regulator [Lautropia sp.]|nr:Crp/Fnr family transcriptional regulator [Lautropia sp.]